MHALKANVNIKNKNALTPKKVQIERNLNTSQGHKNSLMFLTHDITVLNFLQGFTKEIYKEDYKKTTKTCLKHVENDYTSQDFWISQLHT